MDPKEKDQQWGDACYTCLAIPGKIIEISAQDLHSALVDALGVRRRVDVTFIQSERPAPGDWILIHVGFAMSKISEHDAADRLRSLELLGETKAAAREVFGYDSSDDGSASAIK